MKFVLVLSALAAFATANVTNDVLQHVSESNTAYNYIEKYGIPRAEELRKAEESFVESDGRIVGGRPASLGQIRYQAGLIGDIIGNTTRSVCGGSILTKDRILTAAHCWQDGRIQLWRFTVVLGSTRLFSGGTRIQSTVVAVHPNWSPMLARHDIAIIYLPVPVQFSATIGPIGLPSGAELNNDFAGASVIASGFGLTSDDGVISQNQYLSYVTLTVITNSECAKTYPFYIQPSHICTSGVAGRNICIGDSGGAIAYMRNNEPICVGVTSFTAITGCELGFPAVFARVTFDIDFIRSHIL